MGGKSKYIVGLLVIPVVLLAFIVIVLGASHAPSAATCGEGAFPTGDQRFTVDADQRAVVREIVAAVRAFPATADKPHAAVVALATARQESGLRNLDYGDRDSLGVFQQRPSQGWGSPAQVMNVGHATTTFLRHLVSVPRWETRPVTEVAAEVQRPAVAFRDSYEQWVPLSVSLTQKFWAQAASLVQESAGCLTNRQPDGLEPGAMSAIARAQSWIDERVPYSQSTYHANKYGTYRQDCSGYVSLVWGLANSFTTYSLPSIAHRIAKEDLRAGDIMLRPGHTLIFHRWANLDRTRYWAFEQQRPGRIATHYVVPYPYWPGNGTFVPYRRDLAR